MDRLSAYIAMVAMVFALVAAPLFHVHDHDDHGHAGPLVHAHFLETEKNDEHTGVGVEEQDSHSHVRWINVFTVNTAASLYFHAIVEVSEPLTVPAPLVTRSVLSVQVLRAHSPPERANSNPRSPPSI
jgi:hypothetical protein